MTPLQREVNRLLRILVIVVIFYDFLVVLALFVLDLPSDIWLQILAVITGSVSAGLLMVITLNYSWGAVRISQKGGLVQQINAIESLSNVTVLCTDKTGTLTANKIKYNAIHPVGLDKQALEQQLAAFASSASSTNKTSQAIIDGLGGQVVRPSDEVPFSSARKWSALAFDTAGNAPVKGRMCWVRWRCYRKPCPSTRLPENSWRNGQPMGCGYWCLGITRTLPTCTMTLTSQYCPR
jgi:cation-transporting ATPase E